MALNWERNPLRAFRTPVADRILYGKIIALDARATALAIADGTIIAVSDRESVAGLRHEGIEILAYVKKIRCRFTTG